MKRLQVSSLAVAAMFFFSNAAADSLNGDAENGAKFFAKQCKSCHQVGPDAKKRVGPPLNNIINMPASAFNGFKYSSAIKKAAEEGWIWSFDQLDAYIEKPRKALPKTRMSFRGVKNPQARADIIAYLATFSASEMPQEAEDNSSGTVVPESLIAMAGDVEYGEYLSSECSACHRADGGDDGIPSIIGWDSESFVTALYEYKVKHRDNEVMQLVAGRLAEEEIAALAAYFETIEE